MAVEADLPDIPQAADVIGLPMLFIHLLDLSVLRLDPLSTRVRTLLATPVLSPTFRTFSGGCCNKYCGI
jgi:hypothetical protein